jgi:hypothetical protein
MAKLLLTTGVAGVLLLAAATPGFADEGEESWQHEFRIEGLDKLMRGMNEFLRSIPRFQAPYIDENGDIIIRRVPPDGPAFDPWFDRPPPDPDFADT